MPLEPLLFRPARNEGKRLNTARRLRESLVREMNERTRYSLIKQKNSDTIKNRDFAWFQKYFGDLILDFFGQGSSLIGVLTEMYSVKKRPLRIIDYGAGRGLLPLQIKRILLSLRVPSEVILVDINTKDYVNRGLGDLIEDKTLPNADRVSKQFVEKEVPTNSQDLSFDNFGGFTYAALQDKKSVLLKHLESLSKGGILFASFQIITGPRIDSKEDLTHLPHVKESGLLAIEDAITKRGFKVEIFIDDFSDNTSIVFLIAQRTDVFPKKKKK